MVECKCEMPYSRRVLDNETKVVSWRCAECDGEVKLESKLLYCENCLTTEKRDCSKWDGCKPNPLFKCSEHIYENNKEMAGLGALFGPVCVICGIDQEWIEAEEVNQKRSARRKNHPCYGCKHLKSATVGVVQGPLASLPVCALTTKYGKTSIGNSTVVSDLAHTKCDDYEEPGITLQDACDSGKCNEMWAEHAPDCVFNEQLKEDADGQQ